MTPERWEQIGQLYHAAMELAPTARAAFLDQVCAGDEELRREVESLIAANESDIWRNRWTPPAKPVNSIPELRRLT
jgi:serine/threonine-protein kinase